jgi:hypothetical protein
MRTERSAAILVEEPPEIEFSKGMFYVRDASGCRAYRPATFFAAIATAVEESRGYRFKGAEVIPLHAASASGSPSK